MYKLYTDKQEIFECDIQLEGASLNNSKARLVIETTDLSLLFKGNITYVKLIKASTIMIEKHTLTCCFMRNRIILSKLPRIDMHMVPIKKQLYKN